MASPPQQGEGPHSTPEAAQPEQPASDAVRRAPTEVSAPPPEPRATTDEISHADVDALMRAATESRTTTRAGIKDEVVKADSGGAASGALPVHRFEPAPLETAASPAVDAKRVTMLSDVNLRVKIELGRTRMLVEDVLKLTEGSVVELDKLAGDPVDVYVNDRLMARGEVLVLKDNFCVRVSEVLSHDPHRVCA